jgi:hypothetical protein
MGAVMTEQISNLMPIAAEDVKKAYMERVYAMSHAELFHELMRVHTESARLLQDVHAENERLKDTLERLQTVN